MSSALRIFVCFLAGVLVVLVLGALALFHATGDLPADLSGLSAWSSPQESRILDANGVERARFRLVEPSSWPTGEHEALVEAFLAASPPTFYEPRTLQATSLASALRRVLSGQGPPASPLSIEISRWLLSSEPAGPRRRLREDLLSTWLDAEVPVHRRVIAWMDRVPLCLGRRGLLKAARVCLGGSLDQLGLGDRVTLAAAAAWRLDLAGDRGVLEARRGLVFDTLVVRGRIRGDEAARQADRGVLVPRPSGISAWIEFVGLGPRHRLGRSNDARAVTVRTTLDWSLQASLLESVAETGGFAVLDPRTGDVLALGGDVLRPLGGGKPTSLDLAAWLGTIVRDATRSGRIQVLGEPLALRLISEVGFEEEAAESTASIAANIAVPGRHPELQGDPRERLGVASFAELPVAQRARKLVLGRATALIHEELVAVWFGEAADVTPVFGPRLTSVAFSTPERYSWSP